MTWKLYGLASGATFLVTYAASLAPSFTSQSATAAPPPPQAIAGSAAEIDIVEQADRLQERVKEATEFREPARDLFRFGAPVRRVPAEAVARAVEVPAPVASPPPRPPFGLAGIATDIVSGMTQRTAILSSLQGVLLVHDGDVVEGGYRILTVEEEAVTVEATRDGIQTRLTLSN